MCMPWSPSGGFLQKGYWAVMGYAAQRTSQEGLGGKGMGVMPQGWASCGGSSDMGLNLPAYGP